MARLARTVAPGWDDDCASYKDYFGRHCREARVQVWAWVLMPARPFDPEPSDPHGLRRALS
jgi:hypothetical protein